MSEDEVNERFNEVLIDAMLADQEAEDEAVNAMREEFSELLDAGRIPVFVREIEGHECIAVPAEIMHSLVTAIKDHTAFCAEMNYQLELGNAALIVDEILTDEQIKGLVTKCTFITLAYIKHREAQDGRSVL